MTRVPSRSVGIALGLALAVLAGWPSPAPAQGRQPDVSAAGFAAAWAVSDLEALRAMFDDETRLTIGDRTRTGVRPEQAVAALRPLLAEFEGPTPLVVRAEPDEPDGESGFAEVRWEARFRADGTPRPHTFIVTFVRRDVGWRISDLRILS